jgi:hypothetical protein
MGMSKVIPRFYKSLETFCLPNKALIIYGPRRVGKTTTLRNYLAETSYRYRLDSGDNLAIRDLFASADFQAIKDYVAGYDLIAIDEAQKIPNIGETLKVMIDEVPNLRVIATGSSSFELAGQVGEPLTGRKITLTLYPIAQLELKELYNKHELKEQLERRLIYGSYPEVLVQPSIVQQRDCVMEIMQSYLLKDILALDRVKNSKVLFDLLRLLAFQLGNEVSYSELAQKLMIDGKTVARYLDLLEKSFVIYNLRGYSSNLRNEITRKSKFYFYDNGIRNALIANFNGIDIRNDVGSLWENFLVIERIKKQNYLKNYTNNYFWRTWEKSEIDWVEEREGGLFAYEFKFGAKMPKAPKDWVEAYPKAHFVVVNQDNYLEFIT